MKAALIVLATLPVRFVLLAAAWGLKGLATLLGVLSDLFEDTDEVIAKRLRLAVRRQGSKDRLRDSVVRDLERLE